MKIIELSTLQARVLTLIWRYGPLTPSHIGLRLEFEFEEASARVTRPLKALQEMGLIVREARNQRVVQYRTPSDILPPFRIKKDQEGSLYRSLLNENA